jgi:hypothetical protein
MGTSHEDICVFVIVSHWILLRMRNVSDKICGENQNIDIICNNLFSKYCAINEVMCENMVYPHRPQMSI